MKTFVLLSIFVCLASSQSADDCGPPSLQNIIFDCPTDWIPFEDTCYLFVQDKLKKYIDARTFCTSTNARLVRIDNLPQYDFLSNYLTSNAFNKTRQWYTSGRMDQQRPGQFIWEGHSDDVKAFSNSLLSLWLMEPPRKGDNIQWPDAQSFITFGSNAQRWGFYLTFGDVERPFVCQAEKRFLQKLTTQRRDYMFGASDLDNIQRGPCIYDRGQPDDVLYITSDAGGTPVQFNCEAYGNPPPIYNWYQISGASSKPELVNPLLPKFTRFSQTNGVLVINTPTQSSDAGYYQCEARNMFGATLGNKGQLSFGDVGNPSKIPESAITVYSYRGINIPCSLPSYSPQGILRFIFHIMANIDDPASTTPILLEVRPNLFVSEAKGGLYFSSVTNQDAGLYVCILKVDVPGASGRQGRRTQPIQLNVLQDVYRPQNPLVVDGFPAMLPPIPLRGQRLRLECVAYGRSDGIAIMLSYLWTRRNLVTNAIEKIPGRAKITDFGRVITIDNLELEDSGRYACRAVDTDKRISPEKTIEVQVQSKPFFVTRLSNAHVDVGSTARFECKASGLPTVTYRWFKDNELITDLLAANRLDKARYNVSLDASKGTPYLEIKNVREMDQGMYGCEAKNDFGALLSFGQLRALAFAPNFLKYPVMNLEGVAGSHIFFECRVEASPSPVRTWFFNDVVLAPDMATIDANTGVVVCATKYCLLKNGNLFITSVQAADSGTYTCSAENPLGTAKSSGRLRVLEQLRPVFRPMNQLVLVNSTIDLPCQVAGAPGLDINYAWIFEGVEIKFDRFDLDRRRYEAAQFFRPYTRDFGTLRISNIQYEDEGNYTCLMETPLDSIRVYAMIRVMGPPGPPAGVLVPTINNQSDVPILWRDGTNNYSPFDDYRLELQLDGASEWHPYTIITQDQTVKINEAGIFWGLRSAVIQNLPCNQTYRARIVASNGFGWGSPSPASPKFLTMSGPPTVAPFNVTGGGGKFGTLVVTWKPIDVEFRGGSDFTYDINYRLQGEEKWQASSGRYSTAPLDMRMLQSDPTNPSNVQYTILVDTSTFYQLYEVRVRGRNTILGSSSKSIVQFGPWSNISLIRSAENVPTGTVDGVTAQSFNATSIYVSWNKMSNDPKLTGGRVLGYRIVYWLRKLGIGTCEQESSRNNMNLGARLTVYGENTTEAHIIGLTVDVFYCIGVQIFNSAGDGQESAIYTQTTFKGAPSEEPTLTHVNGTGVPGQIFVDWVGLQSRPDEESLDGYMIRYWETGAPTNFYKEIDTGLVTSGYIDGLLKNTRYDVRVYGYSRGGHGRLSSPIVQFELLDADRCVTGASWDGPDIRYVFICDACRPSPSSVILLITSVWLANFARQLL